MQTELRFDRWYTPSRCRVGLGPKRSALRTESGTFTSRWGGVYRRHSPDVDQECRGDQQRAYTAGVHFGFGRWLVNGSTKGLVALTIDPPVQAKCGGSR